MKGGMLTTLYNASLTMDNYYSLIFTNLGKRIVCI